MTQLWLLEDLEPFPDSPEPGAVFAPSTYWVDAAAGIIEHRPVPVFGVFTRPCHCSSQRWVRRPD